MTVIVLNKHKGTYYLTADGRCTTGNYTVSEKATKVYEGKDCIYGICGYCSDILPITSALAKYRNPYKLLGLFQTEEYANLLKGVGVIVATTKFGVFTIDRHPSHDKDIEHDPAKRPRATVTPWGDDELPLCEGSGWMNVFTLLSKHNPDTITPNKVVKAIEEAYKVNHTIGGKITQIKLKPD